MNIIGNNMFLPNVPESERVLLMKSNAFRPALEIAANSALFISHVEFSKAMLTLYVRFTDSAGVPIGRLTVNNGGYTTFSTFDSPYTTTSLTTAASSARSMYVAKAVRKHKKDGSRTEAYKELLKAKERTGMIQYESIKMIVRNAHSKLVSGRRTTVSYKDYLNQEQVGILLAAFFGEMTALQVVPHDMNKFEEVRTLRNQRRDFRGQLRETLQTLFGKPKLLVTYIKGHGYIISQFDVGHSYEKIVEGEYGLANQGVVTLRKPEFYRSLADIPLDKGRDEICGKLTYLKMNLSTQQGITWEDNEYALVPLIPSNDSIVNEHVYASVFISTHGGTLVAVDA